MNCQTEISQKKIQDFKNKFPIAGGNLRILQNTLSFMLKNLKAICDENNIPYWIQAGTLLGAYRHSGWIPWDDDLDVGILETDLRKLKQIMANHPIFRIDDYYHFIESYTGRFTRMKFRDERFNIFLDLPVYEYYSSNNIDNAWQEILKIRENFIKKSVSLSKKLTKIYHNEIITIPEDLELVENFYKQEIDAVHKTDGDFIYWATYSVPAHWKRIFPKKMFFPLKKLLYETDYYNVPNQYQKYLYLQYGDVFELPKCQESPHIEAFNLFKNIELLPDYIKILAE